MAGIDWALKQIDLTWEDGGAYALLGSSGCGKTTMLNLISGLLTPSQGQILFDDQEVTTRSAEQRNIAVIAEMLDLSESLDKRASGLTADGKQKISLGRGLVRSDVNAILFDEPLTVIDPHLKWQLRSKLKDLHQQFGVTMIYVTHDQSEALTFADQVVVMHDGMVVQSGSPTELFEQPKHTFVGHFYAGLPLVGLDWGARLSLSQSFEIGVRPEFVRFANQGIPVTIEKVDNNGRARIVQTRYKNDLIKLVVPEDQPIPEDRACLQFDAVQRCYSINDSCQLFSAGNFR